MIKSVILIVATCCGLQLFSQGKFPDGKIISDWFYKNKKTDISGLGKSFLIADYGVANDSTLLRTERIQAVIDLVPNNGDGVIVIPEGTYLSGALLFKPGTHLHLKERIVSKDSDNISNFPVIETQMERQDLEYFSTLINVDKVDGFTLSGKGKIDGNGERCWKSFWLQRSVIFKCTNMDELHPRLLHISHSDSVQISSVRPVNSPFWTAHIYRCDSVRLLGLRIFSPFFPVKAPDTDAIDIDACKNVLIKGCYMSVNDDVIALKGDKGPWAGQGLDNGGNCDTIIEDCTFGFCHGALTCGSESIYNHNIILRRCNLDQAKCLLWLKMRPDTPRQYKYVLIEDIKGNVRNCIFIAPWTQFYDLRDRRDISVSYPSYITMCSIHLDRDSFFAAGKSKQCKLSNFCFGNLTITVKKDMKIDEDVIDALVMRKVEANKVN